MDPQYDGDCGIVGGVSILLIAPTPLYRSDYHCSFNTVFYCNTLYS